MAVLKTLKIATRQSPLALWQANFVKDQLEKFFGEDGAKELSKDNLCSYDFNKVYKYHDDNNKQKTLEYIESNKNLGKRS